MTAVLCALSAFVAFGLGLLVNQHAARIALRIAARHREAKLKAQAALFLNRLDAACGRRGHK